MNWDDLRFFLVVSRHRTLSAAARELAVAQPTVGRRISALEKRLGATLFARSSTGFTLTSSGTRALAFAQRMEQDALGAERQLTGRDQGVQGTVRITASEWLITGVLAPLLGPLLTHNPRLGLELISDARHLNLARREADIAIRPRRFQQAGVVQRAVGDGRGHRLIIMSDGIGDAAREWLEQALPHANRSLKANGRDAMLALGRSGAGLTCLARVVGDAIPELQRVPLAPGAPTPALWLGTHRDARDTPRVRTVAGHVTERLRALGQQLCPSD